MGNILGEPFKDYVQKQIIQRQELHGKKTRSQADITYLNSKNSWVKLGSGVSIDEKRMKMLEGNPMTQGVPLGSTLAQNNVLFNGLSNPIEELEGINKYSKIPRAGVGSDILDIGTSTNNQAYGVGGFRGVDGDFGFSPMPGIIDASLTTLNRGSIKKATVNIKCFNKYQFDVIDVLYLRLGYSIFLEFGYSIYLNPSKELSTMDQSLMNEEYFFSSDYDKSNYSAWLPIIEERRKESGGNYDGMFGVVSNFSWTFGEDGSYNIKLEIISHGDVIESLKVNLPPINKEGLTAAQKQIEQVKIKKVIKKFEESKTFGQGSISETDFYTLYNGLSGSLIEWYEKGTGDNPEPNGLEYILDTEQYTGYIDTISINPSLKPVYKFAAGSTGYNDISADRLQTEMNAIIPNTLALAIKYSFEPALADQLDNELSTIPIYDLINSLVGFDQKNDRSALKQKLVAMSAFQLLDNNTISNLDPGLNYPVIGFPSISGKKSTFKKQQSTRANEMPGGKSYGKSAIEVFEIEYNKSKKPTDRQKLLLEFVGIENILRTFYFWAYTQYLAVTPYDADDDVGLADAGARNEGENTGEPSQMMLDLEQKSKNRIREYLYNVRYFDTTSGGEGTLKNQSSIRQKYEDAKQNEFKKNIEEKEEYKNELDLENIAPTSLDNIVKVTVVNPNINQTTPLNTSEASYAEESSLKEAQEAIKNEKGLSPEQITKNIKEWNDKGLFPIISADEDQKDIVTLNINEPKYAYFIRLGTFLDFLQEKVIPKIETGDKIGQPLITIDTNPEKNICYAVSNTISFDPRKLILSNEKFNFSNAQPEDNLTIYKNLKPFFEYGGGGNNKYQYGKIMNIYFNFNRIQEIFDDVDVKNNISLFEVVKTLCEDINECLGGLNNVEPVITDETSATDTEDQRASYIESKDYSGNTITIIDQTPIPNIEHIATTLGLPNFKEEIYTLDIYGNRVSEVNPDGEPNTQSSPFVKSIGLTTQIDKNYATMITIGATANGEIPGENSTAFSKWNIGVVDRFKNNVIDAVAETGSLKEQNELVVSEYKTMTDTTNYLGLLGFNTDLTINEDYISTQLSIHSNYFAYEQAEITQSEIKKNLNGLGPGSMGFIPFNLKLTLDGISGIKIYNKIKIDTRFLPSNYPNTLKFLVTGIDHTLQDNKWETSISTIATSAGAGESDEGGYSDSVPYTDEELAEQEANDKEVNTKNIVDNSTKGNQTGQASKAQKDQQKENVQKKNNSSTKSKPPSSYPQTEEEAKTLGTSEGPIINPNAYKSPTELELAIKKGMDIINNIPDNIQNKHSLLRTRILQVAASYVGQIEIHNNKGWKDPVMEERYKSLAWGPKLQWCNFSVWLWWYEAFTVGNDYVQSTLKFPNNFDKPKRHPMHPVDILIANSKFKYYDAPASPNPPKGQYAGSGKSRGFVAQGTENSNKNFKRIKRWVDIDKDPQKLKTAIKNNKILPGDAIYFNTRNDRYVNHIGIYLCPGDINCNSIWTIEGNANPDGGKKGGVWKKHKNAVGLRTIQGIGQLFTNQELKTYG